MSGSLTFNAFDDSLMVSLKSSIYYYIPKRGGGNGTLFPTSWPIFWGDEAPSATLVALLTTNWFSPHYGSSLVLEQICWYPVLIPGL